MYGDVVMGCRSRKGEDHEPFERVIEKLKKTSATANMIFGRKAHRNGLKKNW